MDTIGPGLGALCALASGMTWAVINLMVRTLTPPFNSVSINALRTTVAGGLLVAWVIVSGGAARLTSVSAGDFFLLALSIVLASSIGDTVFFESTPRIGLAPALTISMTYPLMATIFAAVALGEPVTLRMLIGSVLTLGGLAMIVTARGGATHGGPGWWLGFGCAVLASQLRRVATRQTRDAWLGLPTYIRLRRRRGSHVRRLHLRLPHLRLPLPRLPTLPTSLFHFHLRTRTSRLHPSLPTSYFTSNFLLPSLHDFALHHFST